MTPEVLLSPAPNALVTSWFDAPTAVGMGYAIPALDVIS